MTVLSAGYHEVPVQSRTVISTTRQITDRSTVTGPAILPEKPLVVPPAGSGGRGAKGKLNLTTPQGVMAYIGSEYKFIVTVCLSLLTLVGALYYFPKVRFSSAQG